MNWLTIITTIISYLWLFAVLVLLWLIWRNSEKQTNKSMQALIEVARQDSESARQAVETTRILAAVVQNEQAK